VPTPCAAANHWSISSDVIARVVPAIQRLRQARACRRQPRFFCSVSACKTWMAESVQDPRVRSTTRIDKFKLAGIPVHQAQQSRLSTYSMRSQHWRYYLTTWIDDLRIEESGFAPDGRAKKLARS
jgi:hypothetical protein